MPYASKLLNSLLAAALALSLAACGSTGDTSTPNTSSPGGASSSVQQDTPSYAYVQGVTQTTRYGTVEGFAEDGALH